MDQLSCPSTFFFCYFAKKKQKKTYLNYFKLRTYLLLKLNSPVLVFPLLSKCHISCSEHLFYSQIPIITSNQHLMMRIKRLTSAFSHISPESEELAVGVDAET